ncbi:tyrosine-type recombinase/integrase [uncultured Microbacterium sp.]|uniref:tyrosine-type recombinase/integrase n=1 Tax=uncultured Microbacterium sp. TaxID=191216 RepID=UPI00261F300D|nr:tyrosine-type recombinase/integrase [uncultured Microbacterium sp.]
MRVEETAAYIREVVEGDAQTTTKHIARRRRAIVALLRWLDEFPGDTWEERWLLSGLDAAPKTWAATVGGDVDQLARVLVGALNALLLARVVRPSYSWQLSAVYQNRNSSLFLEIHEPEAIERLRSLPAYQAANDLAQRNAEMCIARVLLRTGKRIAQLRGEDLLAYADVVRSSYRKHREHLAWELLVALGPLASEPPTLRGAWASSTRSRQHTVTGLVQRYGIPESPVRELLIDYLNEVKPGMDYGSLEGLAYKLVRVFWCEVLAINPDQTDLRLSKEVATAWMERLQTTIDGSPRQDTGSVLFSVRALYRDLSEWSYEEPGRWSLWVAPCPIPRAVSRSHAKKRRQVESRMQARTRMLTPNLPKFVETARDMKDRGQKLLAATLAARDGDEYEVDGWTLERLDRPVPKGMPARTNVWAKLIAVAPGVRPPRLDNGRVNVTRIEENSFWGWAVTETLAETGLRIEELTELSQMSMRQYVPSTTNTIVPLLHVVPSKTDTERLLPMSPELVKVLVEVQRRAKDGSTVIPLSVRYDNDEKTFSDPLPHLFARRVGARQEVVSKAYVRDRLLEIADHARIVDVGQKVTLTPHDFRRLFSTELVASGLPLHIASKLLGHLNLQTTRGYTAVWPEHVLEAHHAFVARRRTLRPYGENREATEKEWADFENHFLLRKVALGDCRRPFATPCVHENACAKCRFLDVDPYGLGRLEIMETNAEDRLVEARGQVWLGEVAALEESLVHIRRRKQEAEAKMARIRAGSDDLI